MKPKNYVDIYIPCACGCGEESGQFYKNVPLPTVNPMQHYNQYLLNLDKRTERRNVLQVNTIDDRVGA